jgi:hypothetical protein
MIRPGSRTHTALKKALAEAMATIPPESRYKQPKNWPVNIRMVDREVFAALGDGSVSLGVEIAARIVRELVLK